MASCRRELSKVTGVRNALKIIRYHKSRLEKIEYDFKTSNPHIAYGEIFSMIEPLLIIILRNSLWIWAFPLKTCDFRMVDTTHILPFNPAMEIPET